MNGRNCLRCCRSLALKYLLCAIIISDSSKMSDFFLFHILPVSGGILLSDDDLFTGMIYGQRNHRSYNLVHLYIVIPSMRMYLDIVVFPYSFMTCWYRFLYTYLILSIHYLIPRRDNGIYLKKYFFTSTRTSRGCREFSIMNMRMGTSSHLVSVVSQAGRRKGAGVAQLGFFRKE